MIFRLKVQELAHSFHLNVRQSHAFIFKNPKYFSISFFSFKFGSFTLFAEALLQSKMPRWHFFIFLKIIFCFFFILKYRADTNLVKYFYFITFPSIEKQKIYILRQRITALHHPVYRMTVKFA